MSAEKRLDAAREVALHQQLYTLLRERIESGDLAPGQKLPSERQLAAEHGVSRTTIRQALHLLTSEGWLYSRPGSGYYVALPTTGAQLRLRDLAEQLQHDGLPGDTRVLRRGLVAADVSLAKNLNLLQGERVIHIQQLWLVHNTPLGVETLYLPFALFPNLLELDLTSVNQTLEAHYGVRFSHALQTVHALLASAEECEMLEATPPLAVLVIRQRTFDAHQKAIVYSVSVLKGERYPLRMTLRRD